MNDIFLTLLKEARLHLVSEYTNLDYLKLYQLSYQHNLTAFVYNQIYKFKDFPEDLKEQWKKETLRIHALMTMKTERFLKLYQTLVHNDLKVIVVKGIICRSLYPIPESRPSQDEDLYVTKQDFDKVKALLLSEGLYLADESDDVSTFVDLTSGLSIELHTSLFKEESLAYGKYQKYFKNAFDNTTIHTISGVDVYSLNYDLHLLFLLMHFVKHFLHGGVGIRQVLDIIMYSEVYGEYIHWDMIYQILDEAHVYTLIMNIYVLSHDYFAYDYNHMRLPDLFCELDYDYHDLLDDILDAGVFGKSSIERLHSSTMTLNAISSGKASVLKSIFPARLEIVGRYPYLKKYPYLLPIAWTSRIYHYLIDKNRGNSSKTVEIGNKRVELLNKYKVIK